MINKILGVFSKDMGVDLGTANTLIYVAGKGIVINEPSVAAINKKTSQILAVGNEAKKMVGRTPAHIMAVRPLVQGVISDFEVTELMLKHFIEKVHDQGFSFLPRPRIVIGIPSGVTEVEKRAVEDAARSAGAREVYLVEEPMAAAIGARLPIQEPIGNLIVDMGGGTSEVAMISLGGIVVSKSLRIAGDKLNQDIIDYVRDEYKVLLGERMAENLKITIGSAWKLNEELEAPARGKDLITGLPKEIILSSEEARLAMDHSLKLLVEAIKNTIEQSPPELVADIMHKGIILAGGGSLLKGLDKLIENATRLPAKITDDPLTAVVRGTGIILEDLDSLRSILSSTQETASQ